MLHGLRPPACAAHAHAGASVLEIGAGDGHLDYPTWLMGIEGWIVGIDPSAGVLTNARLDERHQATLKEFGPKHPQHFDIAVSSFVVEHVTAPDAFLTALHRCLKPGGSAFILTPHVLHYFGATALITQRLHVDEWLLHRLREETILHEHHCPLQYRMNTRHRLTRLARRACFRHVEFQMLDDPGLYEPYFPRVLRPLPVAWSAMVHRLHSPALAGTLLARLEASPHR